MADNVTDKLKGSLGTASGKLLAGALLVGPFWVIGIFWAANTLLSPTDAEIIKAPIAAMLGVIGSGSVIGVIASSLMARSGKIATQKEIAVTHATATDLPPSQHQPQNTKPAPDPVVEPLPVDPTVPRNDEGGEDYESTPG